jgi:hypothetical protein
MRTARLRSSGVLIFVSVVLAAGCGDDEGGIPDGNASTIDAAATADAAPAPDAMVDPAVRGEYLVNHVGVCIDCHTPRLMDGSFDMDNFLGGVECFIDIDPMTDNVGCIHTRNLTNDATGLMNRTDEQVKAMFMTGVRPNGDALHSVMPYYQFGNMTDDDADAIVAYLRTVTGVDHTIPAHEPPWNTPPAAAATLIDMDDVPEPPMNDPNLESAQRGRYLAAVVSPCLECHTPELDPMTMPARPIDMTMPFAGGKMFGGLPTPPFTVDTSHAPNLTSHATGLDGWTAQEIVAVIKTGVDPDGRVICPPMPGGAMPGFGSITDTDAMDIANYLLSLPATDNVVTDNDCDIAGP